MMDRRLYLGIDTSNYKTSVAVVDDSCGLVFEKSELLEVKKGSRGLRQSEAFYQHSMRLPGYIAEIFGSIDASEIAAIGYSSAPRRQEGSYMPCFNAGTNSAATLSAALGIPAYSFSHQEGHAAAIMPAGEKERCIFMHLSGGTTEFLLCEADDRGYDMTIAGGTRDISFGQLLDRFGVAAGYPFPSGSYLDDIAYEAIRGLDASNESHVLSKIRIDDGYFNLSGPETRLLGSASGIQGSDGEDLPPVCAELFIAISDILRDSAVYLSEKYKADKVYLAGGVASSKTVRSLLTDESRTNIIFGDPLHSGDNAAGTAKLAKRIHEG